MQLYSVNPRFSLVLALFILMAFTLRQSLAATLETVDDFGENPGRLKMHVYIPEEIAPKPALVVALHGCDQQASDFDDETGLLAFAKTFKFVLLLPEQREANNQAQCFNWFQADDNEKDRGETASIRNMIGYAIDNHGVDPSRVFVLGLSAGGSMTAVLMANYPELFQGGAIFAGTPYACNKPTFWTWMRWSWLTAWIGDAAAASYACGLLGYSPSQRTPETWGDYVRAASGATPEHWPKLSLWQGGGDKVVSPGNLAELVKQWTNVHAIDLVPDKSEVLNNIRHELYRDEAGEVRLETYTIEELDHAYAIDPGTGTEQCGSPARYIKDADICSSRHILKFWGIAP